jgi:hypothetical protein
LLDGASPFRDGWPFRVGILQAEVLPLVGEGITGAPVIGNVSCSAGGAPGPKVGTIPAAGVAYLVGPDGQSCYGRDQDGHDNALPSSGSPTSTDQPFLAAFGHPAFGALTGGGMSFLAPAAGLQRALDVVAPEYQGGKDQLAAWQPELRQHRPGWPAEVNDLQFLTGPSIAELDGGSPGEEVVAGTASMDLQGFSAAGTDVAGWPKLTGDWTVANPAIGSFGTLDTADDAQKVVIGLTRSGKVLAYDTDAQACAPASWPQFHHDPANSGDARRDAIAPGRPTQAQIAGATLAFVAPGDDLLCGRAARYEVRTSSAPIDGDGFDDATAVAIPGDQPLDAGESESIQLPAAALDRYVAVRAVDEQDNVGRLALVDRGAGASTPSPGGGNNPGGGNPGANNPGGGNPGGGNPGGGNPGGGNPGGGNPGGGNPGGGNPGASGPGSRGNAPSTRATCLARNGRLTSRGFGSLVRLGASRRSLDRRLLARGTTLTACVTGGGRLIAVLRGGRVQFVVSTAPGHRANRARPGMSLSAVRRAYPRLSRLSAGLYRPYKRSRIGIRVRAGRVTAIAVYDRRLARAPRRLGPLLRRALR